MPEFDAYLMVDWSASSRPLGSNGAVDAVKVHRPRDWASRGDDFDAKHRNNFCTFCRCHTDIARFDQVWTPATVGSTPSTGCEDTVTAFNAITTQDTPVGPQDH
jgi:hypothetical protein